MIDQLVLRNFLSFGPESEPIDLASLNVIIGPNGVGKSNVIESLGLLQGAPSDLWKAMRETGGAHDLVWKGEAAQRSAQIQALVRLRRGLSLGGTIPLGQPQLPDRVRYGLNFSAASYQFGVDDEFVERESPKEGAKEPYFFFRYRNGQPVLNYRDDQSRGLRREDIDTRQSILSQRVDPDHYPELAALRSRFADIALYREWSLGRRAPARVPQPADARNDRLSESTDNLGLVVNRLSKTIEFQQGLRAGLQRLSPRLIDVNVSVEGGTVQLFFQEKGLRELMPATRASDGTLKWLMLLALLLNPTPPALMCIEEPELGLHPDLMPALADLLMDASRRAQLVVTTHSDILVDALSSRPDAILVADRAPTGTVLRRLDSSELSSWLNDFGLGHLWLAGHLGGVRE